MTTDIRKEEPIKGPETGEGDIGISRRNYETLSTITATLFGTQEYNSAAGAAFFEISTYGGKRPDIIFQRGRLKYTIRYEAQASDPGGNVISSDLYILKKDSDDKEVGWLHLRTGYIKDPTNNTIDFRDGIVEARDQEGSYKNSDEAYGKISQILQTLQT
ncbi:hypothetical protein HYU92_01065 [Candidatus Curtissbacteria bacterium]|nr:hypothetical protein [Candidatus Curtissbacteria bacterium]